MADRDPSLHPPLDLEVLALLVDPEQGGDPVFLAEIAQLFSREKPPLLAELSTAAAAGDAAALARAAHTLKGSAANLGATRMQETATELELLGRANSTEGASPLVEDAAAEFVRVEAALQVELERLRSLET